MAQVQKWLAKKRKVRMKCFTKIKIKWKRKFFFQNGNFSKSNNGKDRRYNFKIGENKMKRNEKEESILWRNTNIRYQGIRN